VSKRLVVFLSVLLILIGIEVTIRQIAPPVCAPSEQEWAQAEKRARDSERRCLQKEKKASEKLREECRQQQCPELLLEDCLQCRWLRSHMCGCDLRITVRRCLWPLYLLSNALPLLLFLIFFGLFIVACIEYMVTKKSFMKEIPFLMLTSLTFLFLVRVVVTIIFSPLFAFY